MVFAFDEKDFLACCGSARFAAEMTRASPFPSLQAAVAAARDVWFDRVDVSGWLEAFAAHPQIGGTKSAAPGKSDASAHYDGPIDFEGWLCEFTNPTFSSVVFVRYSSTLWVDKGLPASRVAYSLVAIYAKIGGLLIGPLLFPGGSSRQP